MTFDLLVPFNLLVHTYLSLACLVLLVPFDILRHTSLSLACLVLLVPFDLQSHHRQGVRVFRCVGV